VVEFANLMIEQFQLRGLAQRLRGLGLGQIESRVVDAGEHVFENGRLGCFRNVLAGEHRRRRRLDLRLRD